MHHDEEPFDEAAYLASFSDPEQRELARLQGCFPGGEDACGSGRYANVNRASRVAENETDDDQAMRLGWLIQQEALRIGSSISDIYMIADDPGFILEPCVVPLPAPASPQQVPRSNLGPQPRRRLAMLSGKVAVELYTAASFMVWRYGQCFNAQLTINVDRLKMSEKAFGAALSAWNKSAAKYLKRPLGEHRKRRCRRRMSTQPQHHFWLYVYEQGEEFGLHVHELCVVPRDMRKGFEIHAVQWWSKRAGFEVPESALKITYYSDKRPEASVRNHFMRVRYLLKSVDPLATRITADGDIPLTHIFQTEPYHKPDLRGVAVAQLHGYCRELCVSERSRRVYHADKVWRYNSALERESYDFIYSGWEYGWLDKHAMISTLMV